MKALRTFSRIFVGLVFVYSGFVKGIDPLGSDYKFTDYFEAFHLGFLSGLALPLAFFMVVVEFVIGVALLTGIRMKVFSWLVMGFMTFFTILTFILAIYNPVSDCGCFGDAMILTNWQTFWKNIIIMVFTLVVFLQRNKYSVSYSPVIEWGAISIAGIVFLFLSLYSFKNLPVIDFRPYSIGTHIPTAMSVPENAPMDEYKTIFYYKNKKTGQVKEFNDQDYPWQDTINWAYESYESKLVKKGYEPPIHDFSMSTREGSDITDIVLAKKDFSFMLVSYKLEKVSIDGLKKANEIATYCEQDSLYSFYCLSSSTEEEIQKAREKAGFNFDVYAADEITLKTIVRSNPGLVLIKDGIIIGKWHHRNFPNPEELTPTYLSNLMTQYRKNHNNTRSLYYLSLLFFSISVSYIILMKFVKK